MYMTSRTQQIVNSGLRKFNLINFNFDLMAHIGKYTISVYAHTANTYVRERSAMD